LALASKLKYFLDKEKLKFKIDNLACKARVGIPGLKLHGKRIP
jgi:hypothetical protein